MRWRPVIPLVLLCPALAGAAELSVTQTPVGNLALATVPNSLVVAPDSARMIMAAMSNPSLADKGIMLNAEPTDPHNDSARPEVNPISLYIDGQATIPFDSFLDPTFSPDARHVAWAGKQDKTWRLVLDGKTLADQVQDVPPTPIVFAPDSSLAAWTIKKGDQYLVTVGTQHWPPLNALSLGQMGFSPDGRHFAVIALTDGAGWRLVVDGAPLPLPPAPPRAAGQRAAAAMPRLDRLTAFAWRPDSSGLAYYAGFIGEPWQVFAQNLDGAVSFASAPVDATMKLPPVFSPDGRRLAAAVSLRGKWSVLDIPITPAPASAPGSVPPAALDQVLPQFLTYYQPPGGADRHFATLYLAQQNKHWHLYVDGRPSEDSFDSIILATFVLAPDKHHYAFAATRGGQTVVVRDGATVGTYNECGSGTFAFSPDSRHLAYGARSGSSWYACVDGVSGIPLQALTDAPMAFSPDSSRIAFVARTPLSPNTPPAWRLIVGQDGALQSKPFDSFIKGSHVNWRPDGTLVTLALQKKVALRIEAKP